MKTQLEAWGIDVTHILDILIPIAILLFGWIAAILLGGMVRRVLNRTHLDDRIARLVLGEERAAKVDTARWMGKFVYYVAMLFVAVAFLARVGLSVATEPINRFLSTIFAFAPRIIGAAALLFVAWIIARLARTMVVAALEKTKLDERIAEERGDGTAEAKRASHAVGEMVYWLIFLLFLPAALGALELTGILEPLQGMLDGALSFMPNIVSAIVIFAAGWFAARIVQRISTNMLASLGVDRLSERYGVSRALGEKSLSQIIGMIVHVLVIIPVAVAALGALELESITRPASGMLNTMMAALPAMFGAALVLGISFFIGKFVAGLVANILAGAGFDRILVKLGLSKTEPQEDQKTPSRVVGDVVLVAIMLFALIEAASLLEFHRFAEMINEFMVLAGHVGLGLVIFGLGLFLAELASNAIKGSRVSKANLLATAARVAILGLAGSMALRQMGLANEIIVLAFAITLGSIAVAVALAFGLGAREEAGKMVREWRAKLNS